MIISSIKSLTNQLFNKTHQRNKTEYSNNSYEGKSFKELLDIEIQKLNECDKEE